MNESRKIALIFPGQGSQVVGMGKELAERYPEARQTFEEADHALGYKLSQLCFEGPEDQLRLTEITQPAILATSVAALRVLQSRMAKPVFVSGHSLGEYSAHVCAGTFSFALTIILLIGGIGGFLTAVRRVEDKARREVNAQ